MKTWSAFLSLWVSLFSIQIGLASGPRRGGVTYPVKYEGGTLPLSQHKIKAVVEEDELVFVHGNQRFTVPVKNITAVSCGTGVHKRFGAAVLGVVPVMHLDKAEKYYVGMTLAGDIGDGGAASKAELVFQLDSRKYREFIAVLERLTGMKVVNTGKIPTVVHYDL